MQAPKVETQTLPPPPGIIGSIRTGFDVIATHVTVILMPVALDLLLWLGPHVSMDHSLQAFLGKVAAGNGFKPEDVNSYMQKLGQWNLLDILRTFPIGITSLMAGTERIIINALTSRPSPAPLTPFGPPPVFQVASPADTFGTLFPLILIGWILGGLYFRWVAALVSPESPSAAGHVLAQTVYYSLIWSALSLVVGAPIFSLVIALLAFNTLVAEGVFLFLGFMSMWLIVPVFFSLHGMFVRKQNALASILSSFQMTRFTLPTSSLFVLTIFLIGVGLNILWSLPAGDSWLTLIGIFGHAFTTTALVAASFVYYQDMTTWLQVVLARLRQGMPKQQA